MLTFKSWLLLAGKSMAYYILAYLLLFVGLWMLFASQKTPFGLIGLAVVLFSLYFFKLGFNIAKPLPKQPFPQNTENHFDRFISIGSGTYNESLNIQGDYIQGDKNIFNNFNFDQDSSSAISEIKQLLKQASGLRNAQQEIINDLAVFVRQKPELKNKLYGWLKSLGFTTVVDEVDAAEKMIRFATTSHRKFSDQFIFQLDEQYRTLKYLLGTAQWREADDETVRILTTGNFIRHRCTTINVDEITPKQLITINRLWLEASGGRFGFSVQKRIWLSISKAYQQRTSFNIEISKYDSFIKAVGWSNEKSRIYHADFDYLITNPKGYLPAKIFLWESYNPNSNYCFLSRCLFDDLMDREYSNFSLLPAWLRRYLLID